MDVSLLLTMPRVDASVPLTRRVAVGCLKAIGVPGDDVDAISLALTEACTNVLQHGQGNADYDIVIWVEPLRAVIEITEPDGSASTSSRDGVPAAAAGARNTGAPVPAQTAAAAPDVDGSEDIAEGGRGLLLMRSVMDELSVSWEADGGTVLRMVKSLQPSPGSPLLRVSA